jgi:hypothetical protein
MQYTPALVGLIIVAAFLAMAIQNGARSPERSEINAESNKSQHKATDKPTLPVNVQASPNDYKPYCATKQDADICVQLRIAEAAEVQAVYAFRSFCVLVATLMAAAWAAICTGQAATEGKRSANAATKSADALVRAEGAQIFITPSTVELRDTLGKQWTTLQGKTVEIVKFSNVAIQLHNLGKSPATIRAIYGGINCGGLPATPLYSQAQSLTISTIAPQGHADAFYGPPGITPQEIEAVQAGTTPFHFFCKAVYADVFDNTHELCVMWKYNLNRKTFDRVWDKGEYTKNT